MFSILVVEDDISIQKLMNTVLTRKGYGVFCASCAEDALKIIDHQYIDLAILDVMLPGMNGFDLCRELRYINQNLPVLMVTAMNEPIDKQRGFIAGTDDYMTKPVDMQEMILRIQALLRRAKIAYERKLVVGTTLLDYDSCSVIKGEEIISLPQKEFYLLFKLLSNPGMVFTRMQLMDEIWGMDSETDEHTVNVHINRLRDKFSNSSDFQIVTIRGLGYKAERLL